MSSANVLSLDFQRHAIASFLVPLSSRWRPDLSPAENIERSRHAIAMEIRNRLCAELEPENGRRWQALWSFVMKDAYPRPALRCTAPAPVGTPSPNSHFSCTLPSGLEVCCNSSVIVPLCSPLSSSGLWIENPQCPYL